MVTEDYNNLQQLLKKNGKKHKTKKTYYLYFRHYVTHRYHFIQQPPLRY